MEQVMISKKMVNYVANSSVIRAMFEEGNRLAAIYGSENVYDFSLGNPNLAPPKAVNLAISEVLSQDKPTLVHGYMNNSGYEDVRETIARSINKKFHTDFTYRNIIMTAGAAGGLNVILKTLLDPEDEVIVFAPYFGEYRSYVSNFDGKLVVIPPNTVDFQPNLVAFEKAITKKTKAVIINSPNNPTGVVYSEETIATLADILLKKEQEFDSELYLISDEPYRELAYDNVKVPYLTKYYDNTIVGYSFSKSLSLPGDRIGYLVVPNEVADFENVLSAVNVATRILGYVNAPSLIQRAVAKCLEEKSDIGYYNRNRETLYHGLLEAGYQCIKPEGAFYLFVKSPIADEVLFCQKAKKHNILVVPGSSFDCPGYVRIVYCVSHETIVNSLPKFKLLMDELS